MPSRHSLDLGTSAHYADAAYYDRLYRRYDVDIPFYVETAEQVGGPVLELGCGTGRITVPLARAGFDVVGVDMSETMLAGARRRLAREAPAVRARIVLRRADMRSLRLDRRFRLVISPFNALQHLYTGDEIEACLASVRRHLMPRAGRFVFDVLIPDATSLARDPNKRYKLGKAYHPAGRKRYLYRESFHYDPVSQVQTITMYFDDAEDPEASFATPLCHRQLFPAELEAILRFNGLRTLARYGDFHRGALDGDSESQIYVCALRGPRRSSRTGP